MSAFHRQWLYPYAFVAALLLSASGLGWLAFTNERARASAASESGERAGRLGQPPQCCPFGGGWCGGGAERRAWLEGWRRGDEARREAGR